MQANPFSLTKMSALEGRQLVAYGASLCFLQMQAVGYKFLYAVDDTPGLAGRTVGGIKVFPVERLREMDKATTLVVICASKPHSTLRIAAHLNTLGLTWGHHYVDSETLQFHSMLPRVREHFSISGSEEIFALVRLLSFYSSVPNLSYAAGTWLLVELLEHCGRNTKGTIAECGAYTGGNALVTLMASQTARNNRYYLLDSFRGFETSPQRDSESRMSDFRDVDFQRVQDIFRNFSNVTIRKGYFHNTIPAIRDEEFMMVYVDCDLYEPTAFLCEQLYKRLVKGGYMVFHDYWWPEVDPPHIETFKGVSRAVHEFLGSETGRLVVFPETTHAVLVRT